MKVTTEHGAIVVKLDNGEQLCKFPVGDDADKERLSFERMLDRIIEEALLELFAKEQKLRELYSRGGV